MLARYRPGPLSQGTYRTRLRAGNCPSAEPLTSRPRMRLRYRRKAKAHRLR